MTCRHCHTEIRHTSDPNMPLVHVWGGNALCAFGRPASISDVFDSEFRAQAQEAAPDLDSLIPAELLIVLNIN
jgi:hypothetical protein